MSRSFATRMQSRQLEWALGGGVPVGALELRRGHASWVLKPEFKTANLFQPRWWGYIAGSEHRWARALSSSQCFAVNIFGPLAEDSDAARRALQLLLPMRTLEPHDKVSLHFEFTPEGGPRWLGERRQPTQVDVHFEVTRADLYIGHALVEVKFTESGFGACRGWKTKSVERGANPDRARCLSAAAIVSSPQTSCWLAEIEGRTYWRIMSSPHSSLRLDAIREAGACPFRHGLYQMMRNRVLADELARHTNAEWVEFAVCRHPGNHTVTQLDEPVFSTTDALSAFRFLSNADAVRHWNAESVTRTIASVKNEAADWATWMQTRYFGAIK